MAQVQMKNIPTVTVNAQAQQVYVLTEGGGDRLYPNPKESGATKPLNPTSIKIFYNAQIKDISCCTKLWLCCHPCYCGSTMDIDRSYLYIRENSLEGNIATKSLCCGKQDVTFVDYFDRDVRVFLYFVFFLFFRFPFVFYFFETSSTSSSRLFPLFFFIASLTDFLSSFLCVTHSTHLCLLTSPHPTSLSHNSRTSEFEFFFFFIISSKTLFFFV